MTEKMWFSVLPTRILSLSQSNTFPADDMPKMQIGSKFLPNAVHEVYHMKCMFGLLLGERTRTRAYRMDEAELKKKSSKLRMGRKRNTTIMADDVFLEPSKRMSMVTGAFAITKSDLH